MADQHQNDERRNEPRFPYRAEVQVSRIAETLVTTSHTVGQALNISGRGMGFRIGKQMIYRYPCFIGLRTTDGQEIQLAATVMHCESVGNDVFAVGVRWNEVVDISRFVGAAQAGE